MDEHAELVRCDLYLLKSVLLGVEDICLPLVQVNRTFSHESSFDGTIEILDRALYHPC